jgi:hypothetical protein
MVKRRLNAMKLLQLKAAKLEAKFFEDLYLLECKYNNLSKPLKELRKKIILGQHEPSDEECDNSISEYGDNLVSKKLSEREEKIIRDILALSISNPAKNYEESQKGIPEFWLNVLKRVSLISEMIEKHDEPILKHLYDVDIEFNKDKPYSFELRFYFTPNEYFTNSLLTKKYEFKIEIDPKEPYVFEAPESICSKGCTINWKKSKSVTCKLIEQKDSKGQLCQIEESQPSFFNFFRTYDREMVASNDLSGEEDAEIAVDFEIGYTFKEKVIPRAILYYMGEITDENDESDTDETIAYTYQEENLAKQVKQSEQSSLNKFK